MAADLSIVGVKWDVDRNQKYLEKSACTKGDVPTTSDSSGKEHTSTNLHISVIQK